MAKKPKMSGLNSCDDLLKKMKQLQEQIKTKENPQEIKLLKEQIEILHKQWLEECGPKGKKVVRKSS